MSEVTQPESGGWCLNLPVTPGFYHIKRSRAVSGAEGGRSSPQTKQGLLSCNGEDRLLGKPRGWEWGWGQASWQAQRCLQHESRSHQHPLSSPPLSGSSSPAQPPCSLKFCLRLYGQEALTGQFNGPQTLTAQGNFKQFWLGPPFSRLENRGQPLIKGLVWFGFVCVVY